MNKLLMIFATALFMSASAHAADLSAAPSDMAGAAHDYIEQRLDETRSTHISAASDPYRVRADLDGKGEAVYWAIDMRLKTRFASGQTGRDTLTVLFYADEPVALRRDLQTRVTRLENQTRFAGR